MNQEELAKYRTTLAEQNRRLRREVERLRGLLGQQTETGKAFDQENAEMFSVVSRNHLVRAPKIETFRFEQKSAL